MSFKIIRPEQLELRRRQYPIGTRIELCFMDDPYTKLRPGDKGTVTGVDDMGDIQVSWDTGSTLKLIVGVDSFKVVRDE